MSQENVQAMRGLYDTFNRGDLDTFEKALSRDILWNEAENSLYAAGNPYRSFAALRDGAFLPVTRDFADFRVDLEQLLDAGDTIVTTGRYRGRNKETGKELSSQFCHVLHIDGDGKLDRVQEYADTLQEAEVAGRAQRVEKVQIREPVMS
jgi:uncharacterized protein